MLGDPESFEAEDLPESARQNVPACAMLHDGREPSADQAVLAAYGFDACSAVDDLHRGVVTSTEIFLSPDCRRRSVGTAGVCRVDKVVDVLIEDTFDAAGRPCLLSRFDYRDDGIDADRRNGSRAPNRKPALLLKVIQRGKTQPLRELAITVRNHAKLMKGHHEHRVVHRRAVDPEPALLNVVRSSDQ